MSLLNTVSALNTANISLLGDYTKTDFAWFPEAASSFAADNDWLYYVITLVCFVFFVPMAFAMFYFAIRYNKPKGAKAESNVAHNTPLELLWSIGPSFFLVGMFVLGAKSYLDHRTVPDGANELEVKAQMWSWLIHYGRGTYHPELHLLVDEPVKLSMTSSDVLHALFVPAFRAKKDIVPGRYNYMWFKPTVANEKISEEELAKAVKETKDSGGDWNYDERQFTPEGYRFYDLYCAEYCGTDHSTMQTVVVVHKTLEDLDAWIKKYSKRTNQTPAEYGESLYRNRGCKGCHSVDGTRRTGPSFKETFGNQRPLASGGPVTADENYIRESILDPKAKVVNSYAPAMPSFKGQLSDDDLFCLVEYLKSVSDHAGKVDAADAKAAESEQNNNE
jgi:cytochrome c oxidase subunit 2